MDIIRRAKPGARANEMHLHVFDPDIERNGVYVCISGTAFHEQMSGGGRLGSDWTVKLLFGEVERIYLAMRAEGDAMSARTKPPEPAPDATATDASPVGTIGWFADGSKPLTMISAPLMG